MGSSGANGVGGGGENTHQIPSYEKYSNSMPINKGGYVTETYAHDQRYTYVNLNLTDSTKANSRTDQIGLRNLVTMAHVDHDKIAPEPEVSEQKGGLYFSHGYDGYDIDDVVVPPDYDNVDMSAIAHTLVNNPDFELKLTAHADTSGDPARNQTLSENRLQTATTLMLNALEDEGLSPEEAQQLYDERIAPNSTIVALGENGGPVDTADETKHQGNRVVAFDVIVQQQDHRNLLDAINKGSDADNHEHVVVLNVGTSSRLKEIEYDPNKRDRGSMGAHQHAIADEDVHFAIKLDPERKLDGAHEMTIKYMAGNNLEADNTNFVIENNTPGAVTSAYNFDTQQIDISVEGQVAMHIKPLSWIDPAVIKVGQVTSSGEVTISPLTNAAELAPISATKTHQTDSNPLFRAADDLKSLSITAKHLHIEHEGNPEAYHQALEDMDFEGQVSEALDGLKDIGIQTGAVEQFVISQYSNEESQLYNPDQVTFPAQIYQIIYESEVSVGGLEVAQSYNESFKELLDKVLDAGMQDSTTNMSEPGTSVAPSNHRP